MAKLNNNEIDISEQVSDTLTQLLKAVDALHSSPLTEFGALVSIEDAASINNSFDSTAKLLRRLIIERNNDNDIT